MAMGTVVEMGKTIQGTKTYPIMKNNLFITIFSKNDVFCGKTTVHCEGPCPCKHSKIVGCYK